MGIPLFFSLVLPGCLVGLFYVLKNKWEVMLWWAETALPKIAHPLGKISSLVPFSVGEVLVVLLVVSLVLAVVSHLRQVYHREDSLVNPSKIIALCSLCLWLWAGMCWLWNVLYYVPSFAQRTGLEIDPYPVEDLAVVTLYFAQGASHYAGEVERAEDLTFAVERKTYFQDAITLYEPVEEEFPFLAMESVQTKYLTLSYLQSYFGFTGVYIPFTGEANINIHCPAVLHPATIAHEMAHQRLIAPELEANFLSVLACLHSDNDTFLYSGHLFGLIQLSNALYPQSPDTWHSIVDTYFTPELSTDWQQNYLYWQDFSSPVEEVAKEVYDGFLKSNDQDLGIRSYGACVDLLVAYYKDDAYAWYESLEMPESPEEVPEEMPEEYSEEMPEE